MEQRTIGGSSGESHSVICDNALPWVPGYKAGQVSGDCGVCIGYQAVQATSGNGNILLGPHAIRPLAPGI